ncbi:hypothetical protein QVD17_22779 [Tagetes erecta]|uniref:Uncharacterized protein n=1 Tax=Tagetes erecta TaxID=13708 RepID=A0AAD8KGF5_TARER|nr:hypothetical protein QVD17_22779 [Tagetes erecta]
METMRLLTVFSSASNATTAIIRLTEFHVTTLISISFSQSYLYNQNLNHLQQTKPSSSSVFDLRGLKL